MEKVLEQVVKFGLKVSDLKQIRPCTFAVFYAEGVNNFFTKFFFVGPKGNFVSKHNGKFVIPVEYVGDGYHTGKLIEKNSYYLFKPLPLQVEIKVEDNDVGIRIYYIEYRKDVWGW